MMNNKLIAILLFATLLFACGSTPQKADDAVAVEDQGTNLDETENARTFPSEGDELSGISSLDDPRSLLSARNIYFEYDSSDIKFEDRATVEAHAGHLVANPNKNITLEGHADERGSREYNLALGEKRAQTVKRQMTILGASPSQIRTISYGEERPAINGHDENSWSQNRRVEIIH